MESITEEQVSALQKLKVTLYQDVKRICEDTVGVLDMAVQAPAQHLVAELVWKQLRRMAIDLELFARHGKRTTVGAEDVKLLVRHNPFLVSAVTRLGEEESTAAMTKEAKKKRGQRADGGEDVEVIDIE